MLSSTGVIRTGVESLSTKKQITHESSKISYGIISFGAPSPKDLTDNVKNSIGSLRVCGRPRRIEIFFTARGVARDGSIKHPLAQPLRTLFDTNAVPVIPR